VRWIGYVLPLTYFNIIAKGVMLRGAPLGSLVEPMLLLAALGIVVFALASIRFARDLAPARKVAA
jgi:ABC-2 type transport system permease protein